MFYSVIIPPNNANIELLKLKREIFKKSGLLSSWALPPQIPLQFEKEKERLIQRADIPKLVTNGMGLTEIKIINGQCVLTSEMFLDYVKSINKSNTNIPGLHLMDMSEPGADVFIDSIAELVSHLDTVVRYWRSFVVKTYKTKSELFTKTCWWEKIILEEINKFGIKLEKKTKNH